MTEKQKRAIELLNRCHSPLVLMEDSAIDDDEYMLLMEFVMEGVKKRDPIRITGLDVINDVNRDMRRCNGIVVPERRIRLVLNIRRRWMNVLADIDDASSWRMLTDEERTLRERAKVKIDKADKFFYELSGKIL